MSEIAKAHTLVLQFKASQRFPSMLKNTLRTLVRSVFDKVQNELDVLAFDFFKIILETNPIALFVEKMRD